MPDTRLPDHWLGAPEFDGISDAAWRILTFGYMWSNRYLTDGKIPLKSIKHIGTYEGDNALSELISAGLLTVDEEYLHLDWAAQTPREAFLRGRENTRLRVAKHREEQRQIVSNAVTNGVSRRGEAEERKGEDIDKQVSYIDLDETF